MKWSRMTKLVFLVCACFIGQPVLPASALTPGIETASDESDSEDGSTTVQVGDRSPLSTAMRRGSPDPVAAVNLSPLHAAIVNRDLEQVIIALKAHNWLQERDADGNTLLHAAVMAAVHFGSLSVDDSGNDRIVMALIDAGGDRLMHRKNEAGHTVLDLADEHGLSDLAIFLESRGGVKTDAE